MRKYLLFDLFLSKDQITNMHLSVSAETAAVGDYVCFSFDPWLSDIKSYFLNKVWLIMFHFWYKIKHSKVEEREWKIFYILCYSVIIVIFIPLHFSVTQAIYRLINYTKQKFRFFFAKRTWHCTLTTPFRLSFNMTRLINTSSIETPKLTNRTNMHKWFKIILSTFTHQKPRSAQYWHLIAIFTFYLQKSVYLVFISTSTRRS